MKHKIAACLWFDGTAEEAAEFYARTFPDSRVVAINRAPAEYPAGTDRYWNAIVGNGGEASQCGWCKDRFGLSWQITPRVLMEATTSPDRAAAKRAMEAMMDMQKIDASVIEAAVEGTIK